MKRSGPLAILGMGMLLGLTACVVEQPRSVVVAPAPAYAPARAYAPAVVAPRRMPVVVAPYYARGYRSCPAGYYLGPRGQRCHLR